MKKKYTEDSIVTLSARDFCRLRPGVYAGDTTYSTQLLREIFSNALDEHTSGRGNVIDVSIDTKNNVYSVEDHGQGFPINVYKEDGKTILQRAFDEFNTSGKYDEKTGCYSGSLGCNGQGSKLTNYLSKWLEVFSTDGKTYESVSFKDGIFNERKVGAESSTPGTKVSWCPDPQFFVNPEVELSEVKKLFSDISALCPNLTINLYVDGNKTTYNTPEGISSLVSNKVGNKELLKNRFSISNKDGDQMFDICMTYTSDYSENITAYVNYGITDSGIHISTVKSLLTKQLNKYALESGFIKKESDGFTSYELSEGLFIIFNIKTSNVNYDSQTKCRVVGIDRSLIRNTINGDFPVWLKNNPKEAKIIIDKAMVARKAKAAAQKAKDGIRNAGSKDKKFISLPSKLVDASSKDRSKCSLYITEGDSAANGLIAKRDGITQAVFPIRGKILSCRKASVDKIYSNQEISNIVKAIGLDIDKSTGKLIYDKKKLWYDKIILATDADPDGAQIKLLLINMFWWLCQELVENGHIYVAVPPLYRITTKKNEYIYLKDNQELEAYKQKHKRETFTINRNKGLGEQSPDELAVCLLREETRNVHQLTVDDVKAADDLLECFMGQKVEQRREYLLTSI